jgi:hypothetical protein
LIICHKFTKLRVCKQLKPAEIAQKVQNQYPDIPMGQIEDDIREFLSELNACDVIQAVED